MHWIQRVQSGLQRRGLRWALLIGTGMTLLGGAVLVAVVRDVACWVWSIGITSLIGGALVALTAYAWRLEQLNPRFVWAIIAWGVLLRLVVMQAPQMLSSDIARYHWDGKVLAHGINPYRYTPIDPALDHLPVDPLDFKINHPWLRTVYPALAQGLFLLAYLLTPGALGGLWLLFLCAELLSWLLLWRRCEELRGSPAALIVPIWMPLVIFEGYAPGHLDLLLLPLVVLFLLALREGRPVWAGAWLALSCLLKPLPLLLGFAALRELGVRRTVTMGVVFLCVVALSTAPFIGAGEHLTSSMWLMAQKWSFNGSVTAWLESLYPHDHPRAHLYAGVLMVGGVALGALIGRDLLSRSLLALTAWVIFTPALFPWYLICVVPILAMRRDPALLALVSLAPLVELVNVGYLTDGRWHPLAWASTVQYGAFYSLLLVGAIAGWGMFRRREAPQR